MQYKQYFNSAGLFNLKKVHDISKADTLISFASNFPNWMQIQIMYVMDLCYNVAEHAEVIRSSSKRQVLQTC